MGCFWYTNVWTFRVHHPPSPPLLRRTLFLSAWRRPTDTNGLPAAPLKRGTGLSFGKGNGWPRQFCRVRVARALHYCHTRVTALWICRPEGSGGSRGPRTTEGGLMGSGVGGPGVEPCDGAASGREGLCEALDLRRWTSRFLWSGSVEHQPPAPRPHGAWPARSKALPWPRRDAGPMCCASRGSCLFPGVRRLDVLLCPPPPPPQGFA